METSVNEIKCVISRLCNSIWTVQSQLPKIMQADLLILFPFSFFFFFFRLRHIELTFRQVSKAAMLFFFVFSLALIWVWTRVSWHTERHDHKVQMGSKLKP